MKVSVAFAPMPAWSPAFVLRPRRLTVAAIQERVADFYGIPRFEMVSARRSKVVARPRQVAMYLAKRLTPKSLPDIGRRFGKRDHTTVIHAIKTIEALKAVDAELAEEVGYLEEGLLA